MWGGCLILIVLNSQMSRNLMWQKIGQQSPGQYNLGSGMWGVGVRLSPPKKKKMGFHFHKALFIFYRLLSSLLWPSISFPLAQSSLFKPRAVTDHLKQHCNFSLITANPRPSSARGWGRRGESLTSSLAWESRYASRVDVTGGSELWMDGRTAEQTCITVSVWEA